ncbi:MAG: acetyl-CoA carboxylase, carboxyltransferase subunit beta [candidate division KSB1 bacterium]|nr:acetyl-CoA carboxylase, carboxyltransferase subunit beta [candidate division KSB1 bacterium]MDZ7367882.1 acetyl-CoA carboxylase, carboxyltransferase subunit beta [candidate division KSB1 bacterium]MDZ7405558.1 acetyl-CoA carboxylase, carboxyltransferase subunit beta [candidate division KSB1 bacterium]
MAWFKRERSGLLPQKKKDMPHLWVKCDKCGEILYKSDLEKNCQVCMKCGYHFRIGAADYIKYLLDEESFQETHRNITPVDALKFRAHKKYADQLKEATKKSGNSDAIITGAGKLCGRPVILAVMDFSFIGGSMGSVVGEKIALTTDDALHQRCPLIIISASGGARMMEGALSLMQMAKTSARLARFADAGLPFISILTHPTTGGVTASYAMLGDVNIAEPGALIGFAGPRVIKQTIGEDLPEGFQTAEFLLKHGFIDAIFPRTEMRRQLINLLDIFMPAAPRSSKAGMADGHQSNALKPLQNSSNSLL